MDLRWGILGTGRIARTFGAALGQSRTGALVAVGSRRQANADQFASLFPGTRAHPSYDALLADAEVDAVYISVLNHLHLECILAAAAAGKHILCEKPMTLNQPEAMTAFEAVRYHDVFLMEAFMYRCHPQTQRLRELLEQGAIGDVRQVQATFTFNTGPDWESSRFGHPSGGGAILDVGCYCASMSRLVAGAPIAELKAVGTLGPSGLDELSSAVARHANGVEAGMVTGIRTDMGWGVHISGTEGSIEVPNPWFVGEGENVFTVKRPGAEPERIVTRSDRNAYALEADHVAEHIDDREGPAMTREHTLDTLQTLDAWRAQLGIVWEAERPATAARRTPVARTDHGMSFVTVEGVDKPLSRFGLGTIMMGPEKLPLATALLDAFVEFGGTTIDTALVYGSEQTVGQWLTLRGIHDDMVVIGKGAHPDHRSSRRVHPEAISEDLLGSLERMALDRFDIYVLHRDDPDVPVGEIVDCLDEHRRAGRIGAYGGSNWTAARLEAANDYARAAGRPPFVLSSPNLALAIGNDVPWPGCLSISGNTDELGWYEKHQLPVLSWSAQCQGFFTNRYPDASAMHPETARVWSNDANWERKRRAARIGERIGATANQIALAWLLHRPFPVIPLIGPWTIDEMRESLEALSISLTADDLAQLDLQS